MIYAVSDGSGIGNRLKNLVSALRQAHYENDGVTSHLGMQEFLNFNQYSKTFQINVKKELMTHKLELLPNDEFKNKLKKNVPIIYHNPHNTQIEINKLDFQYNNIDDEMIVEWLKYWELIVFNNSILHDVDLINQHYNIEDCIGVHVRSWSDNEWRNQNIYSFEKFVVEMEKFEGKKFFLACDSDTEIKKFKNYFGDRIITIDFSGERHSKLNDNAYYYAFLDMLLLSKCKKLIVSYLSTFSECAWWLGKCNAEVIMPKTESLEKVYKSYYQQLSAEMSPIKFSNVPKHKNDTGEPGEVAFDDLGNFYICVKKDLWAKQKLSMDW